MRTRTAGSLFAFEKHQQLIHRHAPSFIRDGGEFAPGVTENQLRGLAFGHPGARDTRALRQATFVHKDKGSLRSVSRLPTIGTALFLSRYCKTPIGSTRANFELH
jgi:hypothetical protein